MNKQEENYESPTVKVVEVAVEQGFAASGGVDAQSVEKYDLIGTFQI